MTESVACRTERANPAQSIAFHMKGFDRFHAQKSMMLTNSLSNLLVEYHSW